MSDSLPSHGLKPTSLLCPWNSAIKSSGVGLGYHSSLWVIFLTQGSKPDLLYCRWIHYHLSNQGSPKTAECQRTDTFKLWCWGKFLRVPPSARKSNQSIPKEIKPEYLLGRLMLKLKFQNVGHLMWRPDWLEKTLMLGKTEGKRRRGWQRMRWLDSITTQWTWI